MTDNQNDETRDILETADTLDDALEVAEAADPFMAVLDVIVEDIFADQIEALLDR